MINLLKHPIESLSMAPVPYWWMVVNLGSAALNASRAMEASKASGEAFGFAVLNLSAATIFAIRADKIIKSTIELKEQRDAELRERNFNWLNEGLLRPTLSRYFDLQDAIPDVTTEECSKKKIDFMMDWIQPDDVSSAEQEQRGGRLPHPLVINQAGEVVAGAQFKLGPGNSFN